MNEAKRGRRGAIVIIAPHFDDETLGCAGVILNAKRNGNRVRVLYVTNSDGFAKAAALLCKKEVEDLTPEDFMAVGRARQRNALDAARTLGLFPEDMVFLGYPDGGLTQILSSEKTRPVAHKFTGKDHTYGLLFPDYHSRMHGEPSPCTLEALSSDITELLEAERPNQIYVTHAADSHSDHSAAHALAIKSAIAAGFDGEFYTYLIHFGRHRWPVPCGATPDAPFISPIEDGRLEQDGLSWPPDDRRPMSPSDSALKLKALQAYDVEMRLEKEYIESFVKSEEVFWRWDIRSGRMEKRT